MFCLRWSYKAGYAACKVIYWASSIDSFYRIQWSRMHTKWRFNFQGSCIKPTQQPSFKLVEKHWYWVDPRAIAKLDLDRLHKPIGCPWDNTNRFYERMRALAGVWCTWIRESGVINYAVSRVRSQRCSLPQHQGHQIDIRSCTSLSWLLNQSPSITQKLNSLSKGQLNIASVWWGSTLVFGRIYLPFGQVFGPRFWWNQN